MKCFNVGEIGFSWIGNEEILAKNERLNQFSIMESEYVKLNKSVVCNIVYDNVELHCKGDPILKNGLMELYENENGKFMLYHWNTCRYAYGFYISELKNNVITYYFNPDIGKKLRLNQGVFFANSGAHKILAQQSSVVFHASYVIWRDKALLFAGVSGSGKSTQASLWERFQGAEIINGDRVVLKKKDGQWYAYGYPGCGSSNICVNRNAPIRALVLLEHGTTNECARISLSQKFRAILTGCEMFLWDDEEKDMVLDIAKEIINDVKIVKLICRPDEEAVKVLQMELEKQ